MIANFSSSSCEIIVELVWLFLSLATQILDVQQKILARILWFPQAALSIYVSSRKKLYGKAFYYAIASIINAYAYIQWNGTKKIKPIQVVSRANPRILFPMVVSSLTFAMLWTAFRMKTLDIPIIAIYFDTLYAVLGFLEKILMSKKKLERWILASTRYLLFTISCIKVNSPILAFQSFALGCISLYGQFQWYISYKKSRHCHIQ